jgi:hypothetical protein
LTRCSQRSANEASGCSAYNRVLTAKCGRTLLEFPPP